MAPSKSLSTTLPFVMPLLFSLLVLAQSQPIIPAASLLPPDSPDAGAPLFEYERLQLTEKLVQRISEQEKQAKYGSFFTFGDLASPKPMLKDGSCRSFPGDKSWVQEDVWGIFNNLLGKALIPTIPIAASCYMNWGLHDAEKCAAVIAKWNDPYLHEADPTSVAFQIFQGRTCLPTYNPNGTCALGGYPAYAVNISNVAQIQLTVNFARNANIRLVIKNTGHCYLGKSGGAGALSVWTHNLKDIKLIKHYAIDGYEGKALKVGAGVTVREVYLAAHRYGVTALGGICDTVGFAGGYIAGGGHTPLSGLYGMAADHVMALEVVTADGKKVTASQTSHTDLYWALRGGGGSTFAIVTSVIIRVHPKVPVTLSSFSFNSTLVGKEAFWLGVRAYFELFIPFTDAGTYSYFWIDNTNGTYRMDMKPFWAPNHTIASFNELVKPWFEKLTQLGIPFTPETKNYPEFWPAFNEAWPPGSGAVGGWTTRPGNRLFPRANWEDPVKFNQTFSAIQQSSKSGYRLGGYHQAPRNRAHVSNAVNSAWRTAISFLILGINVAGDATPVEMGAASAELKEILEPWRDVAPNGEGGGSYLNEADVGEPDWQSAFYGNNYPRLRELKRKWDPEGVFYATTAVGSEDWVVKDGYQGVQTQNGRLCRKGK